MLCWLNSQLRGEKLEIWEKFKGTDNMNVICLAEKELSRIRWSLSMCG